MNQDRSISDPTPLIPLTDEVHRGLPIVAAMGVISFITTVLLFFRLSWLFYRWRKDGKSHVNQFIILIFNLVIADVQQAAAFMLNAYWLNRNAIGDDAGACWAQGWFVSTGDLASGIFTFAIAIHAFADIVWDFRLKTKPFYGIIAALWAFIYACSILGIAIHPDDYYSRAGAWCFINARYSPERLYLHYLWIIIAEFGTVAVYAALYFILNRRLRTLYYSDLRTANRAKGVAKMIVAYPIIYCICTLPLVSARLASMSGGNVSYTYLCVGGAMVTSNGWLDVLLYTLTRSSYILHGQAPDPEVNVIETFRIVGSTTDVNSLKATDSERGLWSSRSGTHSSRASTDHALWANMDAKWENMRIQERASLSLRAMDMQIPHAQADLYAHPVPETPRFFQRIYQADNITLTPPRSPLVSAHNFSKPASVISLPISPIEKD